VGWGARSALRFSGVLGFFFRSISDAAPPWKKEPTSRKTAHATRSARANNRLVTRRCPSRRVSLRRGTPGRVPKGAFAQMIGKPCPPRSGDQTDGSAASYIAGEQRGASADERKSCRHWLSGAPPDTTCTWRLAARRLRGYERTVARTALGHIDQASTAAPDMAQSALGEVRSSPKSAIPHHPPREDNPFVTAASAARAAGARLVRRALHLHARMRWREGPPVAWPLGCRRRRPGSDADGSHRAACAMTIAEARVPRRVLLRSQHA